MSVCEYFTYASMWIFYIFQYVNILHMPVCEYFTYSSMCIFYICQCVNILHMLVCAYFTYASMWIFYICQYVNILHMLVCARRYADCAMALRTEESCFSSRQGQQADVYFWAFVQTSGLCQSHPWKDVKGLFPELKQTGRGTENYLHLLLRLCVGLYLRSSIPLHTGHKENNTSL